MSMDSRLIPVCNAPYAQGRWPGVGFSGRVSLQRPEFRALIDYARPGDTFHISEMFRLVRGTGHILDVLDVLRTDRLACVSTTARSPP